MDALQKHSRLPRKQNGESHQNLAKRPLGNLPEERREEIATTVLRRYMAGEQVANMANEYGTSDVTIYALLIRDHLDEWKDVQRARALARLERAQEAIERAVDALSLARARESVRSAQWELERLLRRIYGQDQTNLQVQVQPVLIITTAEQQEEKVVNNQ